MPEGFALPALICGIAHALALGSGRPVVAGHRALCARMDLNILDEALYRRLMIFRRAYAEPADALEVYRR